MIAGLIFTGLITFLIMEGVAWLAHKYVMHGTLWSLHRDHHIPSKEKGDGFFEKNDWFFIIFAVPAMLFYIFGSLAANPFLFAAAIGITLYGIAYFIFHEIVFHRRLDLRWIKSWKGTYIRALRRAHASHHKHLTPEDGESFGLLIFPFKFLKMEMNK